jgi:hypothetical protein
MSVPRGRGAKRLNFLRPAGKKKRIFVKIILNENIFIINILIINR